ncbi:MAG: DMT family transporter [Desulfobacter sp.]
MSYWVVILIGLIGGVTIGIQSPIAGAMGQKVGGIASSFILQLSGMIWSGLFLAIRGGENIQNWSNLPWYMLASGGLALIFYLTVNITMPCLGSAMMLALIVTGQLLVGILIDHFGLLGVEVRHLDLSRLIGGLLLLVGCYFISK